jgi:monoterpene epsilon-lactone hydrolase
VTVTSDWKLPAERAGRPAPADLVQRRAQIDTVITADAGPGVVVSDRSLGGVACMVCEPGGDEGAGTTVLYFHGGGYRLGAPRGWIGLAGALARAAGARVVVPDYRLAPEHPFPAAVRDAAAVYEELLSDDRPVFVAGDSAGGGLAPALVVACANAGIALPRGVVLLSPWVDLTVRARSYTTRAETDQLFSEVSAREAGDGYLQGHPADDPLASPVFAELAGFPPTLVFVGGNEVLLDDALELTARLARAGASVELRAVAGMQHVWPLMYPQLDESIRAFETIADFVRRLAHQATASS